MLSDRSKLDPDRLSRVLGTSARQVDRLSALIDDLLDVSRISVGKLRYQFGACDLSSLIIEVCDRFSGQLWQASSPLTCRVQPEVQGVLDSGRIEQVITNLVSNAIKYGSGKEIVVGLEAFENDGHRYARITVRDHGMGIPVDAQGKIFDRFERAVSSSNISGLGLGLYISREIVHAHGGSIDVESELGRGSVFTVRLPLWRDGEAPLDRPSLGETAAPPSAR
jgi:signal transduction histidine kinase